jgi:hypothetical protein
MWQKLTPEHYLMFDVACWHKYSHISLDPIFNLIMSVRRIMFLTQNLWNYSWHNERCNGSIIRVFLSAASSFTTHLAHFFSHVFTHVYIFHHQTCLQSKHSYAHFCNWIKASYATQLRIGVDDVPEKRPNDTSRLECCANFINLCTGLQGVPILHLKAI